MKAFILMMEVLRNPMILTKKYFGLGVFETGAKGGYYFDESGLRCQHWTEEEMNEFHSGWEEI